MDWRRFIPYGLGALIPKPAPAAPPTPVIQTPTYTPSSSPAPDWRTSATSNGQPPEAPYIPSYTPLYPGDLGGAPNFGYGSPGMGPPSAAPTPAAPQPTAISNPFGAVGNFIGGIGRGIAGEFTGATDAPGRPNTGGAGGIFGGISPWSAAGVAAHAAAQNPGSTGTASVDLGVAPTVAHLGGHAL